MYFHFEEHVCCGTYKIAWFRSDFGVVLNHFVYSFVHLTKLGKDDYSTLSVTTSNPGVSICIQTEHAAAI